MDTQRDDYVTSQQPDGTNFLTSGALRPVVVGLYSQNFYQNQRVLPRSIYIEPVLTSREECNVATYLRTFFSEFISVFREILSTSMFFCCSIYIETAQNSRRECNEFADFLFRRLSLCLSRDPLSCDTRSLDLCILFKFIFLYL